MCLTVQNLFNDKEIILGREEILEVVKYAIENEIVKISFADQYSEDTFSIDCQDIGEYDFEVLLVGDDDEN